MSADILIADDDEWIRELVSRLLSERGHRVSEAVDGQDAYERAIESPPDLVITDVMMPRMDGWRLVHSLRQLPEFTFVPFIFLTSLSSDDDRIQGFRLGADDFMTKPFRFDELGLRIERCLRNRKQIEEQTRLALGTQAPEAPAPESTRAGVGMWGDLQHVGISSLMVLLEMEKKSGILVVRSSESENVARVFFREGRIIAARLSGSAEYEHDAAIFELLRWTSGRFEFNRIEVDMEDEIGSSTTHLLLDSARMLDESNEAE